jgi:hypothetical protein
MFVKSPGAFLPKRFFNNADKTYPNQTDNIMLVNFNYKTEGLDPSVHSIISNPANAIHLPANMKKLIQVDAEMLTTDKQEENCKYLVKSRNDLSTFKVISVKDLLENALAEVKVYVTNLLEMDILEHDDLINIPPASYKYGGPNQYNEWYAQLNNQCHFIYNSVIASRDKTIIDYKNLLHYSNNRPLAQEELHKIQRLISNVDTQDLALDVMNVLNPEHSFMELLLAFNTIPQQMKGKRKNRILPLMQEIYKLDPAGNPFTLEQITLQFKKYIGEPTTQQLEFMVDNYVSSYNEVCSLFEFKLKLKK